MSDITIKVSYRTLNYSSLVQEMWGAEWNMNDIAYTMSNGRKFESTDKYATGVFSAHLGSGRLLLLPAQTAYPDMGQPALEMSPSGAFLLQEP